MIDNSTKRVKVLRTGRSASGQRRREVYADDAEWAAVLAFIDLVRRRNNGCVDVARVSTPSPARESKKPPPPPLEPLSHTDLLAAAKERFRKSQSHV